MKRREFIDRLSKIVQLNNQISPLKDVPLFCCKQSKINQRAPKQQYQTQSSQIEKCFSAKKREIIVIVGRKGYIRAGSAFKSNKDNSKQDTARRLKTQPTNYNADDSPQKQQKQISILEIDRLPSSYQSLNGRISTEDAIKTSKRKFQRASLTSPCQVLASKPKTGRALYVNCMLPKRKEEASLPSSKRQESAKKIENKRCVLSNQTPQNLQLKKKDVTALRKQIYKNYRRPFIAPPQLTAKSYIVYESKGTSEKSSVLFSFNSKSSQEIASLTKIMTCILTLEICQENKIDRFCEQICIGRMESNIGGTSARLEIGQIYTVDQLLYGLMLPSGNDASLALAVWGGRKLLQKQRDSSPLIKTSPKEDDCLNIKSSISCVSTTIQEASVNPKKSQCYARFIQEMNSKAKLLKMTKTNYANSHGLINMNNRSSAYDIALLCDYAMLNEDFRKIVQTRNYSGAIRVIDPSNQDKKYKLKKLSDDDSISEEQYEDLAKRSKWSSSFSLPGQIKGKQMPKKGQQKKVIISWQNTHKLLHMKPNEYIGIKTGFTTAAGPCLCSCVSIQGKQFIIVVLSCGKMSLKFRETQKLRKWLMKHKGINKVTESEQKNEQIQQQMASQQKFASMMLQCDQREVED